MNCLWCFSFISLASSVLGGSILVPGVKQEFQLSENFEKYLGDVFDTGQKYLPFTTAMIDFFILQDNVLRLEKERAKLYTSTISVSEDGVKQALKKIGEDFYKLIPRPEKFEKAKAKNTDTKSGSIKQDTGSSSSIKQDTGSSSSIKQDTGSSSSIKQDTGSSSIKQDTGSSSIKQDTGSGSIKQDTGSSSSIKQDTGSSSSIRSRSISIRSRSSSRGKTIEERMSKNGEIIKLWWHIYALRKVTESGICTNVFCDNDVVEEMYLKHFNDEFSSLGRYISEYLGLHDILKNEEWLDGKAKVTADLPFHIDDPTKALKGSFLGLKKLINLFAVNFALICHDFCFIREDGIMKAKTCAKALGLLVKQAPIDKKAAKAKKGKSAAKAKKGKNAEIAKIQAKQRYYTKLPRPDEPSLIMKYSGELNQRILLIEHVVNLYSKNTDVIFHLRKPGSSVREPTSDFEIPQIPMNFQIVLSNDGFEWQRALQTKIKPRPNKRIKRMIYRIIRNLTNELASPTAKPLQLEDVYNIIKEKDPHEDLTLDDMPKIKEKYKEKKDYNEQQQKGVIETVIDAVEMENTEDQVFYFIEICLSKRQRKCIMLAQSTPGSNVPEKIRLVDWQKKFSLIGFNWQHWNIAEAHNEIRVDLSFRTWPVMDYQVASHKAPNIEERDEEWLAEEALRNGQVKPESKLKQFAKKQFKKLKRMRKRGSRGSSDYSDSD